MSESSAYDYIGNLSGCSLQVISSGGTTALANDSAVALVALNVSSGHGADMLLDANITSGGITIATTFPEDLEAAYLDYINVKQDAMYSGGVCNFAGNVQTFDHGYKIVTDNCLISLAGVTGSLESTGVNINFNPTVGFWVETYPGETNHTISLMRIKKTCGTCEDYNALYMTEMILYHAINKVTWRIMRTVATAYPPGLWRQYQGALYRWNAYTYSAQYVYELDDTEDTFILKLGWINTTCSVVRGFAAKADINLVGYGSTPPDYLRYRLLYGAKPRAEGCVPSVCFIANPDALKVYLYAGTTADLARLPLFSEYSGYNVASSIQDFMTPAEAAAANLNNWVIGVGGGGSSGDGFVSGDGYGAMGVQLGFAQKIEDEIEISNDSSFKWIYSVTRSYAVYKSDNTSETYSPTTSDTIEINGITEYTDGGELV